MRSGTRRLGHALKGSWPEMKDATVELSLMDVWAGRDE
jgi:hypothetical protein